MAAEALEPRLVLSTLPPNIEGVDSMAIGDVNGDRLADIVVAGRSGGDYVVDIYDAEGAPDANSATGTTVNLLATLRNPLGKGVGPLSVAVGDFEGGGVSELAIASASPTTKGAPVVATYRFDLATQGSLPLNAPVTAVKLADRFTPRGLEHAMGLQLTAADLNGDGVDELIVGAAGAGRGSQTLDVMRYQPTGRTWQLQKTISLAAARITGGVSLSAGDLLGDGHAEIVVGSQANGRVAVIDPKTGAVERSLTPFGKLQVGVRVAVVANEGAPGALVVTTNSSGRTQKAAIVPASSWTAQAFTLPKTPGSGALIPLGGGWVYQRDTIQGLATSSTDESSFPYSSGPAAPTVLFGPSRGNALLVQGFGANLQPDPSPLVTITEPILSAARAPDAPFTDLEIPGDLPGSKTATNYPEVAYPSIAYRSPYSINLPGDLAAIGAGLLPTQPINPASSAGWGPDRTDNTPPTVPAGQDAGTWLRERLLLAYDQAIGVAYQHHYDPFWQPTQGSSWNAVAIGYQSQGVDCTNFTAYAYEDAFGILMSGKTTTQAAITAASVVYYDPSRMNQPDYAANVATEVDVDGDLLVPISLKGDVQVQTIDPPKSNSYQDYLSFTSKLQPGDILYINPNITHSSTFDGDASGVSHAITWLGQYGADANNAGLPLIIDSTGDQPVHYDSSNRVIPGGVHIRPFGPAAPPGQTAAPNSWYFTQVDHALRIIVNPGASTSGS
jgi:cell wall-associated NlpC family hydrolase